MSAVHPLRPRLRVVVADDTPDVRLLLRLSLESNGEFEIVAEACDGRAAVDAVLAHHPDLVILDLAMPVMDGLEAIPILRQRAPECGIVVLSGFDRERMEAQSRQAGADAYLSKGSGPDDVAATLREVAAWRSSAPADVTRPPLPAALVSVPGDSTPPPDVGRLVRGWAAGVIDGDSIEVAYRRNNDLLPMLAHELLNSITVVRGYAKMLRASVDDDAALQCADVVERQAMHMESLIRTSQDARSMELGTLEIQRRPTDVTQLVREVLADQAPAIGRRTVTLVAPQPATAYADPFRLRQIVTNLVTNACKFGPADGAVRIEVFTTGAVVALTVTDDGPGIPVRHRQAIFEKFSRFDHAVPGSGLGLHVARGLARAHGGDLVVVDAARGKGATFALTLPRCSPES